MGGNTIVHSHELLVRALDSAGGDGLLASEFAKKIAGLTGGTLRAYANKLADDGVIIKRYEKIPGAPYMGDRARYWLPEYFEE